MIRKFIKEIMPYNEAAFGSIGRYYKIVNRVEKNLKKKICDFIITTILLIIVAGGFGYMMYEYLFAPQGYYAADYHYDEENNKIIDGYHWVDPE